MLKFLIRCDREESIGLVLVPLAEHMRRPVIPRSPRHMHVDRPELRVTTHLEHDRVASCLLKLDGNCTGMQGTSSR